MGYYVSGSQIREAVEADESSALDIYDGLATAVSRLFDRVTQVADDHYQSAEATASAKIFRANGTEWLHIGAYIPASITAIALDGYDPITLNDDNAYIEKERYLKFPYPVAENVKATVTARWGFASIPPDITQACLEQAIVMFRRKDPAFTEMSGVPPGTVTPDLSPTFDTVAKEYRSRYAPNGFFA